MYAYTLLKDALDVMTSVGLLHCRMRAIRGMLYSLDEKNARNIGWNLV
jgi:hypothetical protein